MASFGLHASRTWPGAADISPPPGDLALRIEHDAVGRRIAPGEPGLPRIGLLGMPGIGVALRIFLTGAAPDELGIAAEPLMQALE
jgi:hypothetical protein